MTFSAIIINVLDIIYSFPFYYSPHHPTVLPPLFPLHLMSLYPLQMQGLPLIAATILTPQANVMESVAFNNPVRLLALQYPALQSTFDITVLWKVFSTIRLMCAVGGLFAVLELLVTM